MMQFLTTFGFLVIVAHQAIGTPMTNRVDITQTAINNGNFKTLVAALTAADLATALKGRGPFTVFAPTDAAFSKLPAGTVESLVKPENKDKLVQILKYHVIAGRSLTAAKISSMHLPARLKTLEGKTVNVSRRGSQLQINDATVAIADVFATNGIIHAIDAVLLPPAARALLANLTLSQ